MRTRLRNGCINASSSLVTLRHGFAAVHIQRVGTPPRPLVKALLIQSRYASSRNHAPPRTKSTSSTSTSLLDNRDPLNPPRSTRPPPLELPTRGDEQAVVYWYRFGRAYGQFYKEGVKAVWYNYKAARELRSRIIESLKSKNTKSIPKDVEAKGENPARELLSVGATALMSRDAVLGHSITRSEFQLLARNSHDIGKLPFFGVLVILFGEWLPLIVPFIPGAVPGTCRIPKQVRGMREKAEDRRRFSFRQGIAPPSTEQLEFATPDSGKRDVWPTTSPAFLRAMLKHLRSDQVLHLSATLGLHSRIWDRLQLPPPGVLLRSRITKHLHYLTLDDLLLMRDGSVQKLVADELVIACEERGLDVLGKKDDVLRSMLTRWLERRQAEHGNGSLMMSMLFGR